MNGMRRKRQLGRQSERRTVTKNKPPCPSGLGSFRSLPATPTNGSTLLRPGVASESPGNISLILMTKLAH